MDKIDAHSTAWILLAIYLWDKNSVTQSEILHSADAINHAMPLQGELEHAIRFLTQQGLVENNGEFYAITNSGQAILESAHDGASNVFDAWKALEERIASYNAV